ncbi:pseudouridine-5'-phosphate glycosidase, partial [Geobacillus thermodenitrificans]
TDILPAFYSRTSPFRVDYRLDSAEEIAQFIETKWALGLDGGIVVANPVPQEDELEESYITSIIEQALKEAEEKHITGKAVTPFLLDRVKTLTEGKSLKANIALVKNNAVLAADIARALS